MPIGDERGGLPGSNEYRRRSPRFTTMPLRGPLGSRRALGTTSRVPSLGSHGSTPGLAATSSVYPTASSGARSTSVSSACASRKRSRPTRSVEAGGFSSGWRGGPSGDTVEHAASATIAISASRAYLDRRSVIDELPDLVHLIVRHGNTAIGPVEGAMRLCHPALAVGKPVDHHPVAGRHACAAREREVVLVRVGDVQRAVEDAVLQPPIDHVPTLGRAAVAV